MARGITSAGKWLWNAVKNVFTKVRKLLPFSDAKEGPFSDLTLSGRRFMTTFSDGVNQGKGSLNTAVDSAFSRIKQTKLSYGVSTTGSGVNPAGYGQRPAQIVQHIKIDRLIETLQLHDVGDRDIDKLVNELVTKLYEKLKRAGETKATGAGMGAIL
jgi:microsomal dipeptidase-like Zn-dependent dipeptidase